MILWKEVCERLALGETVASVTIATSDGSTPRSSGAKMLVGKSGILCGTIGGGLAEAMAAEKAVQTIADGENRLFSIDMGGSAAEGADLICGGMVRIFVQALQPGYLDVMRMIYDRMRLGHDSLYAVRVAGNSVPLFFPIPAAPSELQKPSSELSALADHVRKCSSGASLIQYSGEGYFVEVLKARKRLVLAGGGHVSWATARMAAMVDFDITVLDDREEFASPRRFPMLSPERVIVVPEFSNCFHESVLGYPVGKGCCIAILTRGHMFDYEVLAQALQTQAGYIGMIGSSRKRDALYDRLVSDGVTRGELERVHCPIGLPLGGDTPAEIAVSIVAELVTLGRNQVQ